MVSRKRALKTSLGDFPSATVILNLFLHHADIIQVTGGSYRLKGRATGKSDMDN